MNKSVYKFQNIGNGFKERLIVKSFKYRDDMHKFLGTADNALHWKEVGSDKPDKAGTYAFAGGRWLNVKSLDASILSHI
jgi:hypothetical protein